ncbi:MAG: type II secretion system F family protein [Armatimonadota bacterium]
MPVLISILCAMTVFLFIVGLTRAGESTLRGQRLGISLDPDLDKPLVGRLIVPLWNRVVDALARHIPGAALKALSAELERAGWTLRPATFVTYRIISTVVLAILAGWLGRKLDLQTSEIILLLIGGGIAGFLFPKAILSRKINDRQQSIIRLLPDAIDLLVVCVEAGLGMDAAMDQVVDKMSGPLSQEFKKTLDDIAIGRRRIDALRTTSQRVDVPQLRIFVAALYQAETLGGSISQVLREQSDSLRIQRNLRAREEAAKLPLKLLFPTALCIMPSLFVVVLAPGVIKLLNVLRVMAR